MLDLPLQVGEARARGRITNRQCISMLRLLGLFSWGLVSPAEGMPVVHVSQVRTSKALEPHRRGLPLQVPVRHETRFAAARTEPCSPWHTAHCAPATLPWARFLGYAKPLLVSEHFHVAFRCVFPSWPLSQLTTFLPECLLFAGRGF